MPLFFASFRLFAHISSRLWHSSSLFYPLALLRIHFMFKVFFWSGLFPCRISIFRLLEIKFNRATLECFSLVLSRFPLSFREACHIFGSLHRILCTLRVYQTVLWAFFSECPIITRRINEKWLCFTFISCIRCLRSWFSSWRECSPSSLIWRMFFYELCFLSISISFTFNL